MKTDKNARKYRSDVIAELLNDITPAEKIQMSTKMGLAARLDDLINAKGWGKSEFAEKVNKNPSEITKWLSGVHNFTIDTLAEIALALKMPVAELFAPKRVQVINKVNIIVSVKEVEPAIHYYTPMPDVAMGRGIFNFGSHGDSWSLLSSSIPA